jgi:hypothetical protein
MLTIVNRGDNPLILGVNILASPLTVAPWNGLCRGAGSYLE